MKATVRRLPGKIHNLIGSPNGSQILKCIGQIYRNLLSPGVITVL